MFLIHFLLRRLGPLGLVLTVLDVWRRLPRSYRSRLGQYGWRTARRSVAGARTIITRAVHP